MPATTPAAAYDPVSESDSDFSDGEQDSNIFLGLADGELEGDDEANPLVSRIGGRHAWLPFSGERKGWFHSLQQQRQSSSSSAAAATSKPEQRILPPGPDDVSNCGLCGFEMELLVELFAPLEGSCYDRTLSVWACARNGCQRSRGRGSVRAFRTLTYNARWAAKLEKQKAKQAERQRRIEVKKAAEKKAQEQKEQTSKVNPFSAGASLGGAGGMFGANPFAEAPSQDSSGKADEAASEKGASEDEDDASDEEDAEFRVAEELAIKASLAEQDKTVTEDPWKKPERPFYKSPLYVNTIPEPTASSSSTAKTSKSKNGKGASGRAGADAVGPDPDAVGPDGKPFAKEGYEKAFLSAVDPVFERFLDRVSRSAAQLVRYEFAGEPIAFSNKGEAYGRFWPRKGSGALAQAAQAGAAAVNAYDPSAPGTCEVCGGRRVFEMQLMPNVVNTLRAEDIVDGDGDAVNDAQKTGHIGDDGGKIDSQTRRKLEIERALGRAVADPRKAQDLAKTGVHRSSDYVEADEKAEEQREKEKRSKTGLAWSSVMVFVCEKDCVGPVVVGSEAESAGTASRQACCEELVEVMWEDE